MRAAIGVCAIAVVLSLTGAGSAAPQAIDPVVAAAGDVACDPGGSDFNGGRGTRADCQERATARVLLARPLARLLALGDEQYDIGGCGSASPEVRWLRHYLASHPTMCTLAYWHHPRFSSGLHGSNRAYGAFWKVLYAAGVDLVLVGHDHDYERFAPLDPSGRLDPARGIREFVVGTGGESHYPFRSPQPGSQSRDDSSFGVLELTLRPTSYDWRFVPAVGTFTDRGSAACH